MIFVSILPQFVHRGDTPLRLALMLLTFEAMLMPWLSLYSYGVSRARGSSHGQRVRRNLERITGVVLIALSTRLALDTR